MTVHEAPQDCRNDIEYTNEWETITFGAYRYGECSVCGRSFREYYVFEQVETPEVTGEECDPVVIFKQ